MNERIKELAKQATRQYSPTYYTQEWIQGFAQLIVLECLKIVEPDMTSGDEWCVTLNETAQSIRQHFGVEE
jgi:hypothetical protein